MTSYFLIVGTFSLLNFQNPTVGLDSPRYATREYHQEILMALGEWSILRLRLQVKAKSFEQQIRCKTIIIEYCIPRILKDKKDFPSCWCLGYPLGKLWFLRRELRCAIHEQIQKRLWEKYNSTHHYTQEEYTRGIVQEALFLGVPYRWVRWWIQNCYEFPEGLRRLYAWDT